MSAFDALRHRLRVLLRRDAWERELDEELRFHREMEQMHQAHAGQTPVEARHAASRRIGNATYYREETRHMTGFQGLHAQGQDFRFVMRSLRREPVFTVFVVLTLALGIGANAAMFGVADRLLLRGPEHIKDPDRVVRLYFSEQPPGSNPYTTNAFGYVSYELLREGTHSFEGLAVYNRSEISMGRGAAARVLEGSYVTAGFFPLLGVDPEVGRFFTPEEDATGGAQHVAVIASRLWRSALGGDSAIVGRTIDLDDERYTVVGVAPPGFTGPELQRVDVWLPMSLLGPRVCDDWTRTWNCQWLRVIGRLKVGVTREAANQDATAAHRRAYTGAERSTAQGRMSVASLGANDEGREPTETAVTRWLMGVTIVVLVIACANVINLLLARAVRRRRELVVRLALGAGAARLMRLLLSESLLLAMAGSVAALGVAYGMGFLVRDVLLPNIEWIHSPVDLRVLAVTAGIAVVTGLLVGLVPAIRATRTDLGAGLKAGVREGGGRRSRLRNALTVSQAALSVALLVGAGWFVRCLHNIRSIDLGVEPDRVLAVSVRWPSLGRLNDDAARHGERQRRATFYRQALQRLRSLPGVEHASLTVGMPFRSRFTVDLRVPGWDSIPRLPGGGPNIAAVTSEYFATVGTRLIRGRAFTDADRAGSEPVAIVSDEMARTLWPDRDPIGTCLFIGDDSPPCARIVGIVADAHRSGLREPAHLQYYVPLGQESGFGGTSILIRPTGRLETMVETVRRALLVMDPTLGYITAASMQSYIDPQIRPWKLGATVFALWGLLALVVAAVGLYSVLAYLVEQRAQELGVRVALGARAWNIVVLVLRSSVGMTLIGVAVGLGLALAAGRFIEPLLFEESPRDPVVLVGVVGMLIAVALVASALPAARAHRVDPLEALKVE